MSTQQTWLTRGGLEGVIGGLLTIGLALFGVVLGHLWPIGVSGRLWWALGPLQGTAESGEIVFYALALVALIPAARRRRLQAYPAAGALGAQGAAAVGTEALRALAGLAGAPLLAAAGAALLCGAAQTGFALSLRGLQPDLARISPLAGIQRLWSRRALVEAGKAALKFGALVLLVYGPAWTLLRAVAPGGITAAQAAVLTFHTAVAVLLRAALVLAAAGALDFAYRRYELEQQLRMTRQEAREEQRETDGDPAQRARRRRRARELARRRMLVEVRRADVVVTNPTHVAVALRYDAAAMPAPQVVAKGAELMAERIRAVARASGVLIVENPPLARSLFAGVAVGAQIPPALYRAAAEVLAYVWRVRGRPA
jgi:flagellar biosynthetic protein FlhB